MMKRSVAKLGWIVMWCLLAGVTTVHGQTAGSLDELRSFGQADQKAKDEQKAKAAAEQKRLEAARRAAEQKLSTERQAREKAEKRAEEAERKLLEIEKQSKEAKQAQRDAQSRDKQEAQRRAETPSRGGETEQQDQLATKPREAALDGDGIQWGWPAKGKMVGTFSEADGRRGIDLAGKAGDPVLASGDGKVISAGYLRGYGKLVIIRHNSTYISVYGHNQTVLVKEGQSLAKGQTIAEMGNTDADQVKLHFEIRRQGKPVDPLGYLP